MSVNKQLQMVADWERRKEQKMATDYQLAQQNVTDNQNKLTGLEQYRVNYLKEGIRKGQLGIAGKNFGQHQSFVGKIDAACEQQTKQVSNALVVADQRKTQWLAQQRKRKAVEMLLAKQALKIQQRQDKAEQQMLDELALQKFIRSK
ncbi:flagellar export protein FliJ [uncultured Paraglaciecola sp.]|uniref:flagellar export protein FliJ n=1 Tax=uncultured Paraglaciecola sp. TaxID=1765024 RepID=UPI0030DD0E11|tara:strand:+ start:10116 stop:10556 length:441 start_codon:yes stop_codon:yes gene_type:complete